MFKEVYYIGMLSVEKRTEHRLISKYRNKVSQRLLDRLPVLLREGEIAFEKFMDDSLSKPNPFLTMIKKDRADRNGGSWCQPVILGAEQGITFCPVDDEENQSDSK